MNELQARLGPLPLWGWLVAGVALGGAALLFWKRQKGTSGGTTLGQSQQSGPQPNYNYSSLDPLTGVPYSVESQVNPNTGLPNYYNTQTPSPTPNPVGPPTVRPPDDATAAWRTINPNTTTTPPAAFVNWWNSGHQGPPPTNLAPMLPPGPSGGVNPPPQSGWPYQPQPA